MATIDQIQASKTAHEVQALADQMGVVLGRLDQHVNPHIRLLWDVVRDHKPDQELVGLCVNTFEIREISIIVPGPDVVDDMDTIRGFLLQFADEVSSTEPSWAEYVELPGVGFLTARLVG